MENWIQAGDKPSVDFNAVKWKPGRRNRPGDEPAREAKAAGRKTGKKSEICEGFASEFRGNDFSGFVREGAVRVIFKKPVECLFSSLLFSGACMGEAEVI